MLNSKQLIEITGISRATLNNYVALGILPAPVVKTPTDDAGRATRLGYFDDDAVERIHEVQSLKKQGLSMAQIAERMGQTQQTAELDLPSSSDTAPQRTQLSSGGGQGAPANSPGKVSLDESIDNLPGPAYMVNNNFELIWWNQAAASSFFNMPEDLPGELGSRNLLKLLFSTEIGSDADKLRDLITPHVAAAKKRLSQQSLIKIYSALEPVQLSLLKEIYEETEGVGKEPMVHFPAMLQGANGNNEPFDLYACFYREGILFTYSPVVLDDDFLLEFLSKRNQVINELLKKRKPYLTDVAVMVADVQNSIRICSELPAEEYFELINNIWQQSEPIFRKYYGTYGKHAGDGMVYYFFPQPDCDYKLNAIKCSLELQRLMRNITQQWQARKGWFSDIFLNIGINEGQEWFGSYHAGGHVEFTVLGETINYAARISDFARNGSVWATKSMLNQIPADKRRSLSFGITRKIQNGESVFVTETYASIGSLLDTADVERDSLRHKFHDIEMIPITEIRDVEDKD